MSTEHRGAEGKHGPADGGLPDRWIVWRQDDNGNRFEVARKDSRVDAEQLAAVMEARGHKQLYWGFPASALAFFALTPTATSNVPTGLHLPDDGDRS